jgi:cellulose synthase/poly-beta-1,6-N-acetylglucosamine synthase-like glycosyltransferase
VNQAPRISVLISSYNSARFVAKKLAEIQAQTIFADAEFLFIETGSPERERDLFEPFCREHPNCRLITIDQRKTLYQAWNIGWREARAPVVCYSNMDDVMHPELLSTVAREFDAAPVDVCTVLIVKQPMDGGWNDWSRKRIAKLPLSTRPGPFTAWRTQLRDTLGQFDERFMAAGDKEFWHRIARANLHVKLIPRILYLYTRNPNSLSIAARQSERWQKEKALLREMRLTWPRSLRWQVRAARLRRAVQPSFGFVPAERA